MNTKSASAFDQPLLPLSPATNSPLSIAPQLAISSRSSSLLFVDSSVSDYQTLVAGSAPGTEVHVLNSSEDAVTQITNTLLGRSGISSLHIVSHGEAGGLDFGSSALNLTDLPQYVAQIQSWHNALTDNADILLYGCDVAQGEVGKAFVQILSQLTGADVAASNNLTGKGGDWNLEVATGAIESSPILSSGALTNYRGTLAYTLGARHAVSGGDVFLGGQYIELGVRGNAGYFGTAAAKPVDFFGTSTRANIGLSIDPDSYQTGSSFSYDVFLPGSPYEGWAIGYQQSGTTYSLENAGGASTQITSTTTADTSSGNILAATVTSNTAQNVSVVQTYSFDYTDDYWKTVVTIKNNSATAINNLRYARAYDPDNAVDAPGGDFTTTNTIVNTIAADGKVILSAQVPSSDASFATYGARPSYLISFDPSARATIGLGFGVTTDTLSAGTKGQADTSDSAIALWFDIGTLAAGESKTVQFYTGLSTKILAAAANAPINTVPSAQTTNAGTPITFTGSNAISVADSDSTNLTVTLTAANGVTSLSGISGLSFSSGDGTADSKMTFSGTKADINTALNNLVFSPTTGFSGPASILVETSDGDFSDADTINITVKAGNAQPTISTNTLSLSEGDSVVLSTSNINATDDNTPDQLTYTASSVSGGRFELVANAGVAITTFTQDQINTGKVRFVHDGNETAPSYSLIANDGLLNSSNSTVTIGTFTNINDAPTISTNALNVSEGGSVVLSNLNINATDPDNTASQITYTASSISGGRFELVANAGVAITTFTQDQIDTGKVRFVHNGNETAPSYSLIANDGSLNSSSSTVAIGTFTNVNDAPTIITNALNVSEGSSVVLSNLNINATDPDNTASQITYTASSISGGRFELVANAGVAITTFTQDQINTGKVRFVHDGGEKAPSYSLIANDGSLNSGGSAVTIGTFTNVNSAPTVVAPTTIAVVARTKTAIAGIAFADADAGNGIVTATLTVGAGTLAATSGSGVTVGGTATNLTLSGTLVDINSFIAGNSLTYTTPSTSITTQTLGVSLSDGGNTGTGGTLNSGVTNITLTTAVPFVKNDFNGDGKSDILWRNSSTGQVSIWQMDGTTPQAGTGVIAANPGTAWQIAGTGDFNGDKKADILWRNSSTGQVSIWEMDGTTLLAGTGYIAANPGTAWQIAGTGDFTGDSKTDILWRNSLTSQVSIWEMDGTTLLAGTGYIAANPGTAWQVVGTGDFTGDGKADILWRNSSTNQASIWEMSGTTLLAGTGYISAIPDANLRIARTVNGTGDANGDGFSDIFWYNTQTRQAAVWQMSGTTPLATGYIPAIPDASWGIEDSGDYDGNGKTDLLWRNKTTNQVAVWELDGTQLQPGTGFVTPIASLDWQVVA